MWSGLKLALAGNGLIIHYNRYDEIFIAPDNPDELLEDLLKLNPQIKIEYPDTEND